MILLYANEFEVKYVDYEPKYCIGLGAVYLNIGDLEWLKNADSVILFGCSGWQGCRIKWDEFYEWYPKSRLVDIESERVAELCANHRVSFRSIRYIIDRDRGRVMPWGINHFWRKYQHRRMQLKFNKYLEKL